MNVRNLLHTPIACLLFIDSLYAGISLAGIPCQTVGAPRHIAFMSEYRIPVFIPTSVLRGLRAKPANEW